MWLDELYDIRQVGSSLSDPCTEFFTCFPGIGRITEQLTRNRHIYNSIFVGSTLNIKYNLLMRITIHNRQMVGEFYVRWKRKTRN